MTEYLEQLFDTCTEIRSKSDFGSSIFFRRENYYNGDYKWNFLKFVAGAEKDGKKEKNHFMLYLYRHEKDGAREQTHIFPFVSIQKDGKNERFSFMWRLFQTTKENGKRSGYLFFIPFHL